MAEFMWFQLLALFVLSCMASLFLVGLIIATKINKHFQS